MNKTKIVLTLILSTLILLQACAQERSPYMKKVLNERLSEEELKVIEFKGTERAFTGIYTNNHEEGNYVCRRCGALLYQSVDKFDSGCGWPSFDDEVEGAVIHKTDADGYRTEILCAECDAHLGHVFMGEGFTEKNTRHCVNSVSLRFIPSTGETGRAYFAGGCFWGVEFLFKELDGVKETTVGYSGGTKTYPTYQDVLTHATGHYEAIEIEYDPHVITYEELAKFFFEIHDFEQTNGQGPDIGEQYLSVAFYENQDQKATLESILKELETKGYRPATQVIAAAPFWPAEDYHQDYYEKTGKTPYCHVYEKKF